MGNNLVETNCPLCDSYLNLNESYVHSRYCCKCETLYTPYVDSSLYDESYKDKYIKHWKSNTNKPIQECRWNLIKNYKSSGYLLDIGCGTGSFLREAPKNFSCFGCDINPHCIDYCRDNGINVTGTSIPSAYKRFDIVTMFDVIEHYPNLDIINTIKNILTDDGYFIFCTPNFRSELLENIEKWKHYRPQGEHVFCFSEKSIYTLAEVYGLKVLEVNFNESKIRLPKNNIATYVLKKKE